jgi:hypothetical protein
VLRLRAPLGRHQNAIFFRNRKPVPVPMKDSITLQVRDEGSHQALQAALDGQGRKLGLTYEMVVARIPTDSAAQFEESVTGQSIRIILKAC